jgi:uncharacterized protein (DUF427 family)
VRRRRVEPGPGQESVWDYPRPPRAEPAAARIRIDLAGRTIVDTTAAVRVLETSHPPVYYLPREAFEHVELRESSRTSFCEFKGRARYVGFALDGRWEPDVAWHYPDPSPGFSCLAGMLAVYPGRMDACWVDDDRVEPQPGDFYGGWITPAIVGPFKGAPGTWGW